MTTRTLANTLTIIGTIVLTGAAFASAAIGVGLVLAAVAQAVVGLMGMGT